MAKRKCVCGKPGKGRHADYCPKSMAYQEKGSLEVPGHMVRRMTEMFDRVQGKPCTITVRELETTKTLKEWLGCYASLEKLLPNATGIAREVLVQVLKAIEPIVSN